MGVRVRVRVRMRVRVRASMSASMSATKEKWLISQPSASRKALLHSRYLG